MLFKSAIGCFIERFRDTAGIVLQDWTRNDIEAYVIDRLGAIQFSQNTESQTLSPAAMRLQLVGIGDIIVEHAEGIFLWARLVLAELAKHAISDLDGMEEALNKLPRELVEHYDLTLQRLDPKARIDASIILELVLRSSEEVDGDDLLMAAHCARARTFRNTKCY
jgi:hypothetical protein